MPKKESGFAGVSLKKPLYDDIQQFIDEHKELGYKSVSDFIHEAVRLKIQSLKKTFAFGHVETQQ